jgi:structural maintenance of chromosome 3 (chondroitin sulfate proteoglycan 6)
LDQEITRAVGEVQKAEQRVLQSDTSFGRLREDLRNKTTGLQSKRTALEALQRAKENIEADERRLDEERLAYETEMGSEFRKALTIEEERQLETLESQIQTLRPQLDELSRKRSDLEARKLALEVELNENLRPTLDRLQAQDLENGPDTSSASRLLPSKQRELSRLEKSLKDIHTRLVDADTSIEQATTQLQQLQANKLDMQKKQEELARRIEQHARSVEKNMQKRSQYAQRLADTNREIRDLGVLPEEAFEKYRKWDLDRILRRHHEVKEALKGFQGVNKKAFEQYNSFTRQKETLTQRREELGKSRKSIEELIEHLDQRKDEAIERTFKQVSREFANVFEKLVPAGKGRLIIQRKSDKQAREEEDESDDEDERRQSSSVENYTGVGISVSFNSKHDEQQRIQQLSGGQKSKFFPCFLIQ